MATLKSWLVLAIVLTLAGVSSAQEQKYRPPAVPLVVHNPLFCIWSDADHLTDDVTRHWTKHPNSLDSIIRIDGQSYRLMGIEPKEVAALPQTKVEVTPTRTIYDFEGAGAHVTLTFLTPALPNRCGCALAAVDVSDLGCEVHRWQGPQGVGVVQRQRRIGDR